MSSLDKEIDTVFNSILRSASNEQAPQRSHTNALSDILLLFGDSLYSFRESLQLLRCQILIVLVKPGEESFGFGRYRIVNKLKDVNSSGPDQRGVESL